MTTTYTFTQTIYDEETGLTSEVTKSFETNGDTWTGYDGPMYNFFDFLKGCGFIFDINAQIGVNGVCGRNDVFTPAVEE